MLNQKYKLRKLSVGLVSVGTMFTATTVMGEEIVQPTSIESPMTVGSSGTSAESIIPEAQIPATMVAPTQLTKIESEPTEEESPSTVVNLRSRRSTQEQEITQTMEVDRFSVDTPTASKMVKDQKHQIITRDKSEERELFKVERDVNVDEAKGEINVSLTITPQEIDNGADVIVLLDTSKKMTDNDFNTAKENITKLVNTLTAKNTDGTSNYNNRNSVRLIDFYREIGQPIVLSGFSKEQVEQKLEELRKKSL